jgi:hemerythrin-like domain-containing protein
MSKNAIELLKEDHKRVEELLKEFTYTTTSSGKTRKQLLEKIEHALTIHTTLEEEIFYPAFKAADGSEHKKMTYEALEEHRAVDKLVLPDLKNTEPTSEQFSGRAKVLKDLVEHHAAEEEKEMFKAAEKAMSSEELKDLGEQMAERQSELQ